MNRSQETKNSIQESGVRSQNFEEHISNIEQGISNDEVLDQSHRDPLASRTVLTVWKMITISMIMDMFLI